MGGVESSLTLEEKKKYQEQYNENCQKAAQEITSSDILLVATGAGFSADSGLKVYNQIADVNAYRQMNLEYSDLCVPEWIINDPEIFYGFWGSCFNDYRDTQPHEGYYIIKEWKEKYFSSQSKLYPKYSQVMSKWEEENENLLRNQLPLEEHLQSLSIQNQEKKMPPSGPFFIFTSNVDAHSFKAGFFPTEITEIHGNTEIWQCSRLCTKQTWPAPKTWKFEVDLEVMRAPRQESKSKEKGWENNHPVCINCGVLARPAILFFNDMSWISNSVQDLRYSHWKHYTETILNENPELKMSILEIGAGTRVPSVRMESTRYAKKFPGRCKIIRINPDFPHSETVASDTISILGNALTSLKKINQLILKK